ncbi:HAD family hydrolase [Haloarchaeobius amylolyticus]|uniref:HAD family hydrolase n=1 Tax=Haloarchaeobius amylolyticus TaxID=1198296 RepID=UPI00226DE2C7|nr:HAD family phosphatase [Haloarchaeobius amylolyticus]
MSHDAVLFDMDGVLVDSEDYWVEREREELLPWAVPDEDVAVREIMGMNYREIHDYLTEHYDVAVTKEEWVARFDETAATIYTEKVDLLPGFADWLAARREADIPMAIVSSSPHDWIDLVLDRFDLRFDAVVSAEDIDAPGKPEPHIFEHAAGEVGFAPGDCIAVEDSEHGVDSAVAAGTTCIGYHSGADESVDLSSADFVVDSPEDLLATVDELLDVED